MDQEFNQTLSEGRAQSAVNYIIEKGVQDRLVAKDMVKLNHCLKTTQRKTRQITEELI